VGSDVSYTLSVQNNGPDAAPDVVVADTLASGTSLVSAGASGGSCTGGAARVSCDLHTLASGGTATVTLVVRLVSAGIKTNIATIGSATLTTAARNAAGAGDINQANNAASVTTAVTGPTAAAAISNARQSRTRWREPGKPRLAQISRGHAPFGTTFDFTLNISAVVRFDFTQALAGREVNGRCLAPTRRNEHERLCTRTVIRGTLTVAGHAGVNAVSFYGWLSRSERLKPGRYTVAISAIARHGAGAKTLTFTIVG
jgi:uncharacterized repeat protein (TIGR01451 family)